MRYPLLISLCLLFLVGCHRGESLGKVCGNLKLAGQPVREGLIAFHDASRGIHMTANLRSDGSYEVVGAHGPGLPLGTYQVTVLPPPMDLPVGYSSVGSTKKPSTSIPARYQNPTTSGLSLTVAEQENLFDVDLQR